MFTKKSVLYFIILLCTLAIVSCKEDETLTPEEEDAKIEAYISSNSLTITEKTASGLRYIRTKESTGLAVKAGQYVTVNYVGKLLSGKVFDSGVYSFYLGAGQSITGFDQGVAKMKVGEKATLIFPSSLGYGYAGSGSSIPPYSPLTFDIEVVSAK